MTGGPLLLAALLRACHAARASRAWDWASRRASCGTDSMARSGCPATGVDGGTSSPRITSEAGPDGGPRADARRGQRDAVRPQRRTASRTTVSIRRMRSWNRWVCTTQPAVDGGAVFERHEVGLGKPVGLAPHPASDLRSQGPQPQIHHRRTAGRAGEPGGRDGLDERVRHLVAPDERRPQRMLDRA